MTLRNRPITQSGRSDRSSKGCVSRSAALSAVSQSFSPPLSTASICPRPTPWSFTMAASAISRGDALGVTSSSRRRRRSAAYTVSATSARSRLPRFLWSRKNSRSCWSAGARAGRTRVSAATIASSCGRVSVTAPSARHDARGGLLDHHAAARDRIAHLHRHVVMVHAEPHVDELLLLLVHVAQMERLHLADRDLDLLLAHDAQAE